ncbi:MAG: prolyl oligopeptidase family serine peptidase [Clostridia bacterium]|nr:prolyl oligopeptidase family serine peptidase [Clostridia bacterium]
MVQKEILIKSTVDGTMQPSLFYKAKTGEKRPLLVGLHTWSYDRFNQIENMLPVAEKYNFNLLLPEFRGSNLKENPICTQACGSLYAKQDIKDAIDYIIETENVDTDNIFLLGLSGGGHMALLIAGFCPEYFKAIGAYVPITDLEKWTNQNPDYSEHVLFCCSGDADEMKKRSPMTYADIIAKANLKIFHGKFDPVVPVSHSVELYGRIMSDHPDSRVFLDIFDGGHEIDMEAAMYWIMSQYKDVKKVTVTG